LNEETCNLHEVTGIRAIRRQELRNHSERLQANHRRATTHNAPTSTSTQTHSHERN
jgi:hypothetical protein